MISPFRIRSSSRRVGEKKTLGILYIYIERERERERNKIQETVTG